MFTDTFVAKVCFVFFFFKFFFLLSIGAACRVYWCVHCAYTIHHLNLQKNKQQRKTVLKKSQCEIVFMHPRSRRVCVHSAHRHTLQFIFHFRLECNNVECTSTFEFCQRRLIYVFRFGFWFLPIIIFSVWFLG